MRRLLLILLVLAIAPLLFHWSRGASWLEAARMTIDDVGMVVECPTSPRVLEYFGRTASEHRVLQARHATADEVLAKACAGELFDAPAETAGIPHPAQPRALPLVPVPSLQSTPLAPRPEGVRTPVADAALVSEGAAPIVTAKVNAYRESQGLGTLGSNAAIAEVARAHSHDMAERGFFAHENPDGLKPQDRVDQAGLRDFACGENLYRASNETSSDAEHIASEAFTGWLNSPGHHANMVESAYDIDGVGIVIRPHTILGDRFPRRYDIWVTHLLCRDLREYNRVKAEYEAKLAEYQNARAEYDRVQFEYKAVEERYLRKEIPHAQVKAAYDRLQEAGERLNDLVDQVNGLVDRMNAFAGG